MLFSLFFTVQGDFDSNALLINRHSNGQGLLYLSDEDSTYYVAIDTNKDIRSIHESELTHVSLS